MKGIFILALWLFFMCVFWSEMPPKHRRELRAFFKRYMLTLLVITGGIAVALFYSLNITMRLI